MRKDRARKANKRPRLSIGPKSQIGVDVVFDTRYDGGGHIAIGRGALIHDHVRFHCCGGDITIGRLCSINPYCILYGHGGITIGNHVRIAAQTMLFTAEHGIDDLDAPIIRQPITRHPIIIGDNVWIGAGVKMLPGVTVCDGAVIGAGSVVTKYVVICPNEVVAGVPAKHIRWRGKK